METNPAKTKEENVSKLKNSAHETKEDLKSSANQAGRTMRSMLEYAGVEISHARDSVTTEIRSNPVRSSIIAMGIGVLLGALLRR